MADRDDKNKHGGWRRGSLVERAAEKLGRADTDALGDDRQNMGQDDRSPAQSGGVVARAATLAPQDGTAAATAAAPSPASDRTSARGAPAQRRGAPKRPETNRQPGPSIHFDFKQLQRNGILAPEAKRTRTIEEFRIIKRTVLQSVAKRQREGVANANLVMVTSTRPGEGKTFTSINLAMSIAFEQDRTVLLVDADLSKPSVPRYLGIDTDRGLLDVLESPTTDLSEVMLRTNVESLSILPAGRPHRLSTELLASDRMRRVMSEIARRYRDRIVIIDSPPVLSTSEPSALALHVGEILFVVQAEKTTKPAIREALDLIDRGPSIGLVLNRARAEFGAAQFGSYYRQYGY
jgi:receptor protein-tyrosine kinase